MRTAILGWPQVGKSSLFKMLCGPQAHPEAYGTHVGVARVPDARLEAVAGLYHPKKTSYAALEFLDSPPLWNEPEKDAAVFGQVRGTETFVLVARLFGEDVNPARDLAQLETEFLLVDLDTVNKRLEKVARDMSKSCTPELEHEHAVLEKARAALAAETPLRAVTMAPEEMRALRGFMLLSAKPLLVVLNAGDEEAPTLAQLPKKHNLDEVMGRPQVAVTEVCGKIESELVELDPADAAEFLASYGLRESARDRVLHTICALLGLLTFFTVSEAECRAWLAPAGTVAVEAAGMIHSDFARRFIKAEVISWKDLVECGGLAAGRDQGRVRLEGKDFRVADGDVLYIRHTA
jgi:ribosome-binding ATPase YchF (GTP1/OBG family)